MTFRLFERVALSRDVPEHGLVRGDVATIVERHPASLGEAGFTLEVFNALGETIAVVTVEESAIQPLTANEVIHVRPLAL